MHGFIFSEAKKFVTATHGVVAWFTILEKAGLGSKEFANYLEYPDEEIVRIVGVASEITQVSADAILDDFGAFLGEDLLEIYKPLTRPEWKTLDFLLQTEETIHHAVRTRNSQAKPPALAVSRLNESAVVVDYRSSRRLCSLAKGIARGVAKHYGEQVNVVDESCMLTGAEACRIRVELVVPGPA